MSVNKRTNVASWLETLLSDPGRAEELSDPDRAEELIAGHLLDRAAANDPLLYDLLLLAALPRSFDTELLAALVGRPAHDQEFTRALAQLVTYPFVHDRGNNSWALHDTVRKSFLQLWDRRREPPSDLSEQLIRLGELYHERYRRAREAMARLGQVEALLRSVDSARYRTVSEAIEDELIRTAAESVHTALRRTFDEGWKRLVTTFFELEADRRYHLCDVLVRAWATDASTVAEPARPLHRAWTEYLMARTANSRRQWGKALEILDATKRPEEIDLKYATWHHSERARSLRNLYRFREALDAMDREIAIHDKYHIDDVNNATPWWQKGELQAMLWESDDEISSYEQGLRCAEASGSSYNLIIARLNLAGAVNAVGDREAASLHLLRALRQARTELDDQPTSLMQFANRTAAAAAVRILGPRSSRLLAALTEQHRQLALNEGVDGQLDVLLYQAGARIEGGGRAGVLEILNRARQLAKDWVPARLSEVDLDEAQYATELGIPMRGAELNLALLERPDAPDDAWTRARSLTNAALNFLTVGAYDRGLEAIVCARQVWEEMDHRHAVGFAAAVHAELLRHTGDLAAAGAILAATDIGPARGYEGKTYEYRARLAKDSGAFDEAAEYAGRALDVATAGGNVVDAIESGLLAMSCMGSARRLDEAMRIQVRVQKLLIQLSDFVSWQPTSNSQLADEHAGRAVRILVAGFGGLAKRARSAVEHLEMAIDLDPSVGWYRLETALAELAAGRQRQAAKRLEEAGRLIEDQSTSLAINTLSGEL